MSLNLYGPINDLGYGIVTRGIIKGLEELGTSDFHLAPIGQIQIEDQQQTQGLVNYTKNFWNRDLPSVAVWHEFDLSKFSGKKLVAMPIFETDNFFPLAKSYLSQMDAIFVLSSWAKKVINESVNADLPVFVVPAAANLLETEAVLSVKKAPIFTFISLGKLEKRKGHLELLQAYINAFKDLKVETRLILHCFSPFEQNFAQAIGSLLNSLGLTVINSVHKNICMVGSCGRAVVEVPLGRIPTEQINKLYRYAHIGVFPAKAEGWNLPLMEAIQSGTPCIATNYSAHTEYLTEQYRYPQDLLLSNLGTEVAVDGKFFHGDRGNWCKYDVKDLSEKLLYSYYNYERIQQSFDCSLLREEFTWKRSAQKFMNALDSLK